MTTISSIWYSVIFHPAVYNSPGFPSDLIEYRSVLAYNLTRVMNIVGGQAVDRCDRGLRYIRARAAKADAYKVVFTRPRPRADIGVRPS
jgi:hypothetical protein